MFTEIRDLIGRPSRRSVRPASSMIRPRLEALEDRVVLNTTDLAITMTASPNPAMVNQGLTYTLTVVNNGPQNSVGSPGVIDTLPGNFTIQSVAVSQGTVLVDTGGEVGVALGTIAAGAVAVVTIVGAPVDTTALINTAIVNAGGNDNDPNPANNSATITTNVGTIPGAGTLTSVQITQFIGQVYQDLLNRQPDGGGLASYTALLASGTATPLQVVQSIQGSVEYHTIQVEALYTQLLQRPADSGGLNNWVAFLNQGGSIAQVETSILGSDEFFQSQGTGTNAGFLQALYQDVLGRAVDTGGLQYFGQALTNGMSRAQTAEQILASPESTQSTIQALYPRFLGRPADATGLASFSHSLAVEDAQLFGFPVPAPGGQGLSIDQVIATLLSSPEFINPL